MVRTFDTGLHVPQRTALRRAILAGLAPMLKSNGLYLQAVVPMPGPWIPGDEDSDAMLHAHLQGRCPAAAVALGDAKYKPLGTDLLDNHGTIAVHVYLGSVNPRDTVDGRLEPDVVAAADDTADPGIDTMLEDVKQLLVGQDFGVDSIYEPRLLEERAAFTGPKDTYWEVILSVPVDEFINPDRAIGEVATSIDTKTTDESDPPNVIVETLAEIDTDPPAPAQPAFPVVSTQASNFTATTGHFYPVDLTDGEIEIQMPPALGLGGQWIGFHFFATGAGPVHTASVVPAGDDLVAGVSGADYGAGSHTVLISNGVDRWLEGP